MDELLESIKAEIERLKQSPDLRLTDGWTTSPHYGQGYVAGQLALLVRLQDMIEHSK